MPCFVSPRRPLAKRLRGGHNSSVVRTPKHAPSPTSCSLLLANSTRVRGCSKCFNGVQNGRIDGVGGLYTFSRLLSTYFEGRQRQSGLSFEGTIHFLEAHHAVLLFRVLEGCPVPCETRTTVSCTLPGKSVYDLCPQEYFEPAAVKVHRTTRSDFPTKSRFKPNLYPVTKSISSSVIDLTYQVQSSAFSIQPAP